MCFITLCGQALPCGWGFNPGPFLSQDPSPVVVILLGKQVFSWEGLEASACEDAVPKG